MVLAVLLELDRDMAFMTIKDQQAIFALDEWLCVLVEVLDPFESNRIVCPSIFGYCDL